MIGRRLGLRAFVDTSTWRHYWWSEVQLSPLCLDGVTPLLSAYRKGDDACNSVSSTALTRIAPTKRGYGSVRRAKTVTPTRRGCCWTKAQGRTGNEERSDAAAHRL